MRTFSPILRPLAFAALLALLAAAGEYAVAGPRLPREYEVKAAFVYNFFKFIEWPAEAADSSKDIRICVLGDIPAEKPFAQLQDQSVGGRRIHVFHLRSLSSLRECTVLFIASSEEGRLPSILAALKGSRTLTVGDTRGYARKGVMINFFLAENRVRFKINAESARRAGLAFSSKLLKLAGVVYDTVPAGE